MIFLLIIGLILLLIGIYVAMPAPIPIIFKIVGIVLLVWGAVLLVLYLTGGGADVEIDSYRQLILLR